MSDERLKNFAESAYLQPVKPSDLIFGEGEEPPAFFIVADGEVQASLSDEIGTRRPPVAEWTVHQGQYFGEVGLMLDDAPQLSTYRAGPDRCTLLALPKAAFLQLFGRDAGLLAELHIAMRGEESSLKAVLDHKGSRNLFTAYLRRNRGERALIFYEKVSQYRALEPSGFHAAARSVASGIIVEFLADPEFVRYHTDAELQATLTEALQTNSLHADLLIVVQRQVYQTLEHQHLANFKNSDEFQTFIEMLNSGFEVQQLETPDVLDKQLEILEA